MSTLILCGAGKSADFSANVESLPPAGWTLLATVPGGDATNRALVEIINRSTSTIRLLIDTTDGTATSVVPLEGATAQYERGGVFSSAYDNGRIRVYGPTGTETVSVRTA